MRLAAGLNENNTLSTEAMQRGWDCLSLLCKRLQDIQKKISALWYRYLRTATNVDIFLESEPDTRLRHQCYLW